MQHWTPAHWVRMLQVLQDASANLVDYEQDKIKGAIRTDFILSAEIIVIALGTVADAGFQYQAIVVSVIAIAMTIGVYGLVAAIVKLDDVGLHLVERNQSGDGSGLLLAIGNGLISFAPRLMKFLSIAGTAAMFLVGGGILVHSIEVIHHLLPVVSSYQSIVEMLFNATVGIIAGSLLLAVRKLLPGKSWTTQ